MITPIDVVNAVIAALALLISGAVAFIQWRSSRMDVTVKAEPGMFESPMAGWVQAFFVSASNTGGQTAYVKSWGFLHGSGQLAPTMSSRATGDTLPKELPPNADGQWAIPADEVFEVLQEQGTSGEVTLTPFVRCGHGRETGRPFTFTMPDLP